MNRSRNRVVSPELLVSYVDGDVTPSQAAAIERAIEESPEVRRRASELTRITTALSSSIPELESMDLAARVRAGTAEIDRQSRERARRNERPWSFSPRFRWRWRWPAAMTGLVAAGATALLLFVARPENRAGDELAVLDEAAGMRAKSAGPGAAGAPERWAGISAYRVAGGRAPERLGGRMSSDDGLLFAYTNLGPRPFTHLMVFAVDASGQVRWFHPAYQQAGTNPASIPIQANANVPLAEVVSHPFAPGPATVHALFSRRPLRVQEVEAWLARRPAANGATPWPDSYRHTLSTSIERSVH